jgi:hypothetical protein
MSRFSIARSIVFIVFAVAFGFMLSGISTTGLDKDNTLSQRYHQRTRSTQFFNRSSNSHVNQKHATTMKRPYQKTIQTRRTVL